MKTYQRVVARVRAVMGFSCWDMMHKKIWQEMGRRGLGHKVCPLTAALLLDPQFMSSVAFSTKAEKENIPMWRDGGKAIIIHEAIVEVARARLFDHGVVDQLVKKSLYASGARWAAFARLNGPPHFHLDATLQKEFGAPDSWTDSVKAVSKSLWTGEFDADVAKISSLLPSNLDGQAIQMQLRLKELCTPMQQFIHANQNEAQRLHQTHKEKEIVA